MLSITSRILARQRRISSNQISASLLITPTSVAPISTSSALAKYRTPRPKYYDRILLQPEDVTYRKDDERFLKGPTWSDVAYQEPTEQEMIELTRIKLDKEISREQVAKVDPHAAPFNQILEGVDDHGKFTKTEIIPDLEARWPWVERLLPSKVLSLPIDPNSQLITPLPITPPALPYFVERTRSRLYPLYREHRVVGRDRKTYWRNRWDHLINRWHQEIMVRLDEIKWKNEEVTVTVTMVKKVRGDIWAFEKEAREFIIQQRLARKAKAEEQNLLLPSTEAQPMDDGRNIILTAVNEVKGAVEFKGDFIEDLNLFLRQKGF